MRKPDELKKQALFDATIKLVNEVGFASSSVSKIAKAAGVSPSTLYVYFENKEDLLISTYVSIEKEFGEVIMRKFNADQPLRDVVRGFCLGMYDCMAKNPEKRMFLDQFVNTPLIEVTQWDELEELYGPFIGALEKGIEQKILKDVSMRLLFSFCFYPFMRLANPRHCGESDDVVTPQDVEKAFTMAWDAIRY